MTAIAPAPRFAELPANACRCIVATGTKWILTVASHPRGKKKPAKRGRPHVYDVTIPERARRLAMLGLNDAAIAHALGVSHTAFSKWKMKYPELVESLSEAREGADVRVVQSLFKRAVGFKNPAVKLFNYEGHIIEGHYVEYFPPDVNACLSWLKRRRPQEWGDASDKIAAMPASVRPAGLTIHVDADTLALAGVVPAPADTHAHEAP